MKEFLELFNRFYKEFAKSTFYRCIKVECNEIKSITKREQLYCVCQSFEDQSRRIYFNSIKKSSF